MLRLHPSRPDPIVAPAFSEIGEIEVTDVVFAIDSVPAVFAISQDPFIVYSSNVFAILGLRALYLVLADMLSWLNTRTLMLSPGRMT